MKKKSTSHSAFLNLRVLFGLCVMLTGVFLALVSFGTFSRVFAQNGTTREQMALTLAQALNVFQPPACVPGAEIFTDVPASNQFCPWIEELARRGITGGCGGGKFCPHDPVLRQQMAVFLVKIVASEDFHIVGTPGEPPFQNTWTNFGGGYTTAGFFKDAQGIVHLKGTISGPAGFPTAFTLPEGYRPAENLFLPAAGDTRNFYLLTNGQVQPNCASGFLSCNAGMDGLAFRAADPIFSSILTIETKQDGNGVRP